MTVSILLLVGKVLILLGKFQPTRAAFITLNPRRMYRNENMSRFSSWNTFRRHETQNNMPTTKWQLSSSHQPQAQEQDLTKMTVKDLRQLLKDSGLNERGLLSRLQRKQELIEYLQENLQQQTDKHEEEDYGVQEQELNGSMDIIDPITSLDDDDYHVPNDSSYQDFRDRLEVIYSKEAASFPFDSRAAVPHKQQDAQSVFDEMYEAYMFGSKHLEPQIDVYNLLLRIYALPPAPNTTMTQLILDRMMQLEDIPDPNMDSFVHVMDAWAHDDKPEKAEEVFMQLQQSLQPNTEAYNTLLKAWLKSGKDSIDIKGPRAASILREMLQDYREGKDAVKPNLKTWARVIKCVAAAGNDESTEQVLELLEEAKELSKDEVDWKPDTEIYNAVIHAVANNRQSLNKSDRGALAEKIMYEMLQEYKGGNNEARLNAGTFINVIHAYRGSPDPKAGRKAEKLLELLEGMASNDENLLPDIKAYNAVLDVVGRTHDPKKARRSQRLLNRIREENSSVLPTVRTYNAVLNACAYTRNKDPRVMLDTFRVAVETLNQLRENLEPDSVSYRHFLVCCAKLMPPSPKRDRVVEATFHKCCSDGQVSDSVLQSLSETASQKLYRKLTDSSNKQWSRNVRDSRVGDMQWHRNPQ